MWDKIVAYANAFDDAILYLGEKILQKTKTQQSFHGARFSCVVTWNYS